MSSRLPPPEDRQAELSISGAAEPSTCRASARCRRRVAAWPALRHLLLSVPYAARIVPPPPRLNTSRRRRPGGSSQTARQDKSVIGWRQPEGGRRSVCATVGRSSIRRPWEGCRHSDGAFHGQHPAPGSRRNTRWKPGDDAWQPAGGEPAQTRRRDCGEPAAQVAHFPRARRL